MLNVDCWLWIYTCIELLLNSYMQLDDDNFGASMFERCLFLVMIIWWMIGDKHVYVLMLIMMMMNYVVELLHANDGDIDGECMYAKWRWFMILYPMKVKMMVNCCWTCA